MTEHDGPVVPYGKMVTLRRGEYVLSYGHLCKYRTVEDFEKFLSGLDKPDDN